MIPNWHAIGSEDRAAIVAKLRRSLEIGLPGEAARLTREVLAVLDPFAEGLSTHLNDALSHSPGFSKESTQ